VKRRWILLAAAGIGLTGYGQKPSSANTPFTLTWTAGRCVRCTITKDLGRIQFTSPSRAWAIGYSFPPPGAQGFGDYVVVHTVDAGRTWRELPQTYKHAGDADGPPAFSFLDAARGWIAWWNPADEPRMIRTRDGGRHWQTVSHEFLQKVQFFDENHGYGAEVTKFLRTDDGGRTWIETQIPHLRFIDRMFFQTPTLGWIAGTDDKGFLVFRTTDGGRSWEEARSTAPRELADVRDLFFLDQRRGWLITWHYNDSGTYLFFTVDGGKSWASEPDPAFQGKGKWAGVTRFLSERNGVVFESEDAAGSSSGFDRHAIIYTADGGTNWHKEPTPYFVDDCQVFEGDLLCSASNSKWGFGILKLHWK